MRFRNWLEEVIPLGRCYDWAWRYLFKPVIHKRYSQEEAMLAAARSFSKSGKFHY